MFDLVKQIYFSWRFVTYCPGVISPRQLNIYINITKPHIPKIDKSASSKLGVTFRCPFFTCKQLLRIYKGLIRPYLAYCLHVWRGDLVLISLTGWSQKHFSFINASHLTSQLPSLKLRRDDASLSIFYKYHSGRCSEDFSYCVPGTKNLEHSTRLAYSLHEFCSEVRLSICVILRRIYVSLNTEPE